MKEFSLSNHVSNKPAEAVEQNEYKPFKALELNKKMLQPRLFAERKSAPPIMQELAVFKAKTMPNFGDSRVDHSFGRRSIGPIKNSDFRFWFIIILYKLF